MTNNENASQEESAKEVHQGDVGFVDQKYTLFRHKTIYQIMMYALNILQFCQLYFNKNHEE